MHDSRTPTVARFSDDKGVALVITLLVVLAISAIATGAAVVGSNHYLVNRFYERESVLVAAADAGLEIARARINQNSGLVPDTGYATLENAKPVVDPVAGTLPGVTRSTYVGPTGVTSGQYGVYAAIVTVVEDAGGGRVVRRTQVYQESFAKFAYFSDEEDPTISFGSGDHILGPLHTNDSIRIGTGGATFHDEVRTAKAISGVALGTFRKGYEENAAVINLPTVAEVAALAAQATVGGTRFTGDDLGGFGTATTRIEFIAIDLNADGDSTDANEGFFRVYQSSDADYVVANNLAAGLSTSLNCGYYDAANTFIPADTIGTGWQTSLQSSTRRCYLGGADSLFGQFEATTTKGQWLARGGSTMAAVAAVRPADEPYLFPLSRHFNPDFKGVIYVDGRVAVSGVVRGRVTVVSSGGIVIADDITYAIDPGLGTCEDALGLLAPDSVVIADNTLNAPVETSIGSGYLTFDDSSDEFIHGSILALKSFGVVRFDQGSTSAELCEGDSRGRGCIYLTGGIIQNKRGAVGKSSGYGYIKRYAYDPCAKTDPPPYFPTTGHYHRGQYFQVDPAGFDVAKFFEKLAAS